jgi:hypothetical protein
LIGRLRSAKPANARALQEEGDPGMKRLLAGSMALAAGAAIAAAELTFAPSLVFHAASAVRAGRYAAGMAWATLIALAVVGGGIVAVLARPRNSN